MNITERFALDPEYKIIHKDITEHYKEPRDIGTQEEKWMVRLLYDLAQTARLINTKLDLILRK